MKVVREVASVPEGISFMLMPVQYLGGPYPAIGMYSDEYTNEDVCVLSLRAEKQVDAYLETIGVERLLELASDERVSWRDVLNTSPHYQDYPD